MVPRNSAKSTKNKPHPSSDTYIMGHMKPGGKYTYKLLFFSIRNTNGTS